MRSGDGVGKNGRDQRVAELPGDLDTRAPGDERVTAYNGVRTTLFRAAVVDQHRRLSGRDGGSDLGIRHQLHLDLPLRGRRTAKEQHEKACRNPSHSQWITSPSTASSKSR